jgi:hypothetical protein
MCARGSFPERVPHNLQNLKTYLVLHINLKVPHVNVCMPPILRHENEKKITVIPKWIYS